VRKLLLRVAVFALCALCLFPGVVAAQNAEPNAGTRVEIAGSYDVNGDSAQQATAAGVRVAFTARWSGQFRAIFAPNAGNGGVNYNLGEVQYARKLSDFVKASSTQFNPGRFEVFAYGGAGAARNAIAAGNASFAWSVGGGLNLRINDSTVLTLVEYNYIRSRVERAGVVLSSSHQITPGLRLRF